MIDLAADSDTTVAGGILVTIVGGLIRVRGWTFLIAGNDDTASIPDDVAQNRQRYERSCDHSVMQHHPFATRDRGTARVRGLGQNELSFRKPIPIPLFRGNRTSRNFYSMILIAVDSRRNCMGAAGSGSTIERVVL